LDYISDGWSRRLVADDDDVVNRLRIANDDMPATATAAARQLMTMLHRRNTAPAA